MGPDTVLKEVGLSSAENPVAAAAHLLYNRNGHVELTWSFYVSGTNTL